MVNVSKIPIIKSFVTITHHQVGLITGTVFQTGSIKSFESALVEIHQALDRAVKLCYRPKLFPSETIRIEYLFELYEKYMVELFKKENENKIFTKLKKN